jgi:hypothetical protein
MIERLNRHKALWKSPDGIMQAGAAQIAEVRFYYSLLGERLVNRDDVQGLIEFMERIDPNFPLLLLSNCPGFDETPVTEGKSLVVLAGRYRHLQQMFKRQGRIFSYIYDVAVGGVYLMHGMSAQFRAAAPNTIFHDTVPNRPPVPLADALGKGLLDVILPPEAFPEWIYANLMNKEAFPVTR